MNAIASVARIIAQVIDQHRSLADVLPHVLAEHPNTNDHAFIKAQVFGTIRWYFQLDAIIHRLLTRPLQKKEPLVYSLLLVGIHQLKFSERPDYACVSETVNAARQLNKNWAAKLINAVCRNYLRQQKTLENELNSLSAKYSHPAWLIEKIKSAWPQDWQSILKQNNTHPLFACRVNRLKISRDKYLQKCLQHKLDVKPIGLTRDGIIFRKPVKVQKLPGFTEGLVSVQDIGAQLAAPLLDIKSGMRVLDACAAPGGKATQLLECYEDIQLTTLDRDKKRLEKIKQNLARLNLQAEVVCADAADTKHWWDGKPFDRILLDAPCSGTGVIRRHPDIKILRMPSDIAKMAAQQSKLLTALWPCLKPGGILLYVTCSILPEENQIVMQSFLQQHDKATEVKIKKSLGINMRPGLQLLPNAIHDGFYYAKLSKNNNRRDPRARREK